MGIVNTQFQTVKCDGPNCDKTATYEANQPDHDRAVKENPWLATVRGVTGAGPDGQGQPRQFVYCSDTCCVEAISTGIHNPPTKKVIDIATGSAALKQAAEQAARQAATNRAIREGGPGQ